MSTVLIVDDDALVRATLRRVVEKEGHRVLEATDGRAALRMTEVSKPDVVLTDIFMPDMDGIELVQHLRACHPSVRVVAMSGGGVLPAPYVLQPARALGAVAVLQKPFDVEELRAQLEPSNAPEGS